jgi:hypothetical protein
MAFAWPPSVDFTKTVVGNTITFTVKTKDKNGVQVGQTATYTFDSTVDAPMAAMNKILANAVYQVDQNIGWPDIPASGNIPIPIVDVIEQSSI